MRAFHLKFAAAILLVSPGIASAQSAIVAPEVNVRADTSANQGATTPFSSVHVVNGVVLEGYFGNGGGFDPGLPVPGYGDAAVSSFQNGGTADRPLHAEAYAAASLASGALHGTVDAYGPNVFGTPSGRSESRIRDTVFFDNISGGDITLSLYFSYDGFMVDTYDGNPSGTATLGLSSCSGCGEIRFGTTGLRADDVITAFFDKNGTSLFNTQNTGAVPIGQSERWLTALGANDGVGGVSDGMMGTTILIPPGESQLGISSYLILACGGGSGCDFGHTGLFRFGALANGLSFTSASGVFLRDVGNPGGVPEPATWGMMIGGFAFAGGILRRRKVTAALA